MAKTVADVMKMVKDNEVKFVDFRFTDTRGKDCLLYTSDAADE